MLVRFTVTFLEGGDTPANTRLAKTITQPEYEPIRLFRRGTTDDHQDSKVRAL
jgi:hypothetical protein